MSSLYSATPLQALDERLKIMTLLIVPFGKGREILGVFGESSPHRIVDHVGDRTIQGRGLQTKGAMDIGFEINGGAFLDIHACHLNAMTL